MFALPGLLALVVFMILRPFELIPSLRGLPLLYVFFGIAMLGYALDLRVGFNSLRSGALLWTSIAWVAWVLLCTVIKAPHAASGAATALVIVFIPYFLLSNGVTTLAAFEKIAWVLLGCSLLICLVCLHQSFQPMQCVIEGGGFDVIATGVACGGGYCPMGDERAVCEHVGLMGVSSIGGRVRYTGVLQDPNEVAMLVSSTLPLAFALWRRKPNVRRGLVAAISVVLVLWTVRETESRGGLLVLACVLGLYAIQRFGLKRVALVGAPLALAAAGYMMAGTDGRADAEASTDKRLGCMLTGIGMLQKWPVFGVGFGQFTQYHDQTAHSAYILAAAESGFLGLLSWLSVAALAVKGAIQARSHQHALNVWGQALATSLAGMLVGIFFLSFTYHLVLWIFFGLAGALNRLASQQPDAGALRITPRELGLLTLGAATMLTAIGVYAAGKIG